MALQVLYFASLKEALGLSGETLPLPVGVASVGELRDWLIAAGRSRLGTAKNLRMAVNQEMVKADAMIKDGDEIAFFPPVTGG
jgi:molybdopterin synthase sulfur carrier subunit